MGLSSQIIDLPGECELRDPVKLWWNPNSLVLMGHAMELCESMSAGLSSPHTGSTDLVILDNAIFDQSESLVIDDSERDFRMHSHAALLTYLTPEVRVCSPNGYETRLR